MGDPAPYKACWSQTDDVTIFGGWGAYEQGWEQVGPRLDWAAARFGGGTLACERLTQGMSGDLAYSIWFEKDRACLVGQEEASPIVLRVTHLYRREDGKWKVIHRHADAIIDKIEATAILQREEQTDLRPVRETANTGLHDPLILERDCSLSLLAEDDLFPGKSTIHENEEKPNGTST